MLMLSRAAEVKRDGLRGILTPDQTATWRPVPHSEVVDVLTERAAARGLRIASERFATMPGHLRVGNVSVDLPGGRMFGALDFEAVPGVDFPSGCVPSMGIRNSHDKEYALSVLSGARVLICANGVLMAEHIITRKHTGRLDLVNSVDDALNAFMASAQGFGRLHEVLSSRRLGKFEADSLGVDLVREGAFAASDLLPVLEEFERPSHPEFEGRSAWSLYNAATGRMQKQSPARQTDGFRALNKVMLG